MGIIFGDHLLLKQYFSKIITNPPTSVHTLLISKLPPYSITWRDQSIPQDLTKDKPFFFSWIKYGAYAKEDRKQLFQGSSGFPHTGPVPHIYYKRTLKELGLACTLQQDWVIKAVPSPQYSFSHFAANNL